MKLSAQMTMVIGAIFAVICFGVAVQGFMALGEIADPKAASDTQGFSWFWAFLGAVGATFSGVSWWIARTEKGDRG
jgi:hypothetical protein